jgi:hypothetical protein
MDAKTPYREFPRQGNKEFGLYANGKLLAVVTADPLWPGLFRLAVPADAAPSDVTNLSRAKDAAECIAERGGHDPRLIKWKSCPCEATGSPPMLWPGKSDPEPSGGGGS